VPALAQERVELVGTAVHIADDDGSRGHDRATRARPAPLPAQSARSIVPRSTERPIVIEQGKKAPAFNLVGDDGEKHALSDYAGKNVVLYFYPKDDTPGCTLEAQAFTAALPKLAKLNAVVLGVSKDSTAAHCKFRDKYGLKFPLLSDPEGKVIEKYGAWGEKNMYGKKSMGIIRTTVIIDGAGKVAKVFPKVKVAGHDQAVLDALKAL
jgi:peroxiredoxin Q/BCP